ncbi:MAG: hypothetical protein Q8O90_05675, partial [Elusimicrobiota bacterium]|nr:hypothetical protein [Elusimicrobiota bacterium]
CPAVLSRLRLLARLWPVKEDRFQKEEFHHIGTVGDEVEGGKNRGSGIENRGLTRKVQLQLPG